MAFLFSYLKYIIFNEFFYFLLLLSFFSIMKEKPKSIQVISDIHLEKNYYNLTELIQPNANYLMITGDIWLPYLSHYTQFLKECSQNFEKVFIISGNLEYYQHLQQTDTWTMQETDPRCLPLQ